MRNSTHDKRIVIKNLKEHGFHVSHSASGYSVTSNNESKEHGICMTLQELLAFHKGFKTGKELI